jgi:hypothetical protein
MLFFVLPIAAVFGGPGRTDLYGGCCNPNPFLPLEFILEILSSATVVYLIVAGKRRRRILSASAVVSIRKAASFVARMRHLIRAVVRKGILTGGYHRMAKLSPILLISFLSLLPHVNAVIGCCDSPASNPFQPFGFLVSVTIYGLAIWFILGVGRKEFRSSIYRRVMFVNDV